MTDTMATSRSAALSEASVRPKVPAIPVKASSKEFKRSMGKTSFRPETRATSDGFHDFLVANHPVKPDILLEAAERTERLLEPSEEVQKKVAFLLKNLSHAEMQSRVREVKHTVKNVFMPWLSRYLVIKCVSSEMMFHGRYSMFLDGLKSTEFHNLVLTETYRNIKVLLASAKARSVFSLRFLLWNLGNWLGLLTLAKDKPILSTDLDIKALLQEAYAKGKHELLYVVPFVTKVMKFAGSSLVFQPPHGWTMNILKILVELHQIRGMKHTLRFKIEILCNILNVSLRSLKHEGLLRNQNLPKSMVGLLPAPSVPNVKRLEEMANTSGAIEYPVCSEDELTASADSTDSTTSTTSTGMVPQPPQYNYHDICVYSLAGLAPHITLNPKISLFETHPHLKQYVRQAVEQAVQDLLQPMVECSIQTAINTCMPIVRKDFALDSEESRMQEAAHAMVRNLTAAMARITCREPLLKSIMANIKTSFATFLRDASPQQREMVEQAANQVAQDNCELACCFIQKTAMEKAGPEVDKRLATEYQLRKQARQEGRRYCFPDELYYQAEQMPEEIRLKEQLWATNDVAEIYDKCIAELEQHLHALPPALAMHPQSQTLRSLLDDVVFTRHTRDADAALKLLKKTLGSLLNTTSFIDVDLLVRFRVCHVLVFKVLRCIQAYGSTWCSKHVTRYLMECQDESKYNVEAVELLIWNHLVNMNQFDAHLAQSMENGSNKKALRFAMQLVKNLLVDERSENHVTEASFFHTIQTLMYISTHLWDKAPVGLSELMDALCWNFDSAIEQVQGETRLILHSGISQASDSSDPPGLREKVDYLLRTWVNLYHSASPGQSSFDAISDFVEQMSQQGLLTSEELVLRFFRLCAEICVEVSYKAIAEEQQNPAAGKSVIQEKVFYNVDAFVRLIVLLVQCCGETGTMIKIKLLNKVLGILCGVLLKDHEGQQDKFQQLPYHSIFVVMLLELNRPGPVLETINFQILTAFSDALHFLRPAEAPGFAHSWLNLVSQPVFVERMLEHTPLQKGWSMYAQLLIDLFTYLAPFFRSLEFTKPMKVLYSGTLRALRVLFRNFPEFLCEYYYSFCDVLPHNCIQLRNLILSAFPHNMVLPDPCGSDIKVDMLTDMKTSPRILTNYTRVMPPELKEDLDFYLMMRSPVTFLLEVSNSVQTSSQPGDWYNIPLMNAVVLYVGVQAIEHIHQSGETISMGSVTHSSYMDIFQYLARDLDAQGRYLLLHAIANQLRYPNSHTHYFSCVMLYLFAETNTETIREHIARVLVERLVVNKPHPWGVMVTFTELVRNPAFNLWKHNFVHCSPESEKLFLTAAQNCIGKEQAQKLLECTWVF
ncbi:CCR4-NOT transcription complex subunit 1-like isoform X2 [Hyperolius riggenbachi]|uniref:CCR4-NOT transcription complex subunit 1-like isoform X2 n=1 Tax=Hyperolius riggenbachi TaxID=752182 RepID=UPI0035A2A1ED